MSELQPITNADPHEAFFAQALRRISRTMLMGAPVLSMVAWIWLGGRAAAGFFVGCTIAYFNFSRLKRVVAALAERAAQTAEKQSGTAVVLRFLLRYFLMAAAAYVIIERWPASLTGLLAGLFLPVLAVMVEAAHELVFALTHERRV